MPPKGGGGGAKAKRKGASSSSSSSSTSGLLVTKESGLQAVVLLDAAADDGYGGSTGLAPLLLVGAAAGSDEAGPRALLPCGGEPLLEHTLDFLCLQGVTEVLLCTGRHATEVRAYLDAPSSRWRGNLLRESSAGAAASAAAESNTSSGAVARPSLRVVSVAGANGAATSGDALRAVDSLGLLRGGGEAFLLLEGPVVGNARLAGAIAAHEARAKADANVTLTSVVMAPLGDVAGAGRAGRDSQTVDAAGPLQARGVGEGAGSASRLLAEARSVAAFCRGTPLGEVALLTVDALDGRLWAYATAPAASFREGGAVARPAGAPKDVAARLVRRADLRETGVFVCSAQVAVHLSDNYDYSALRRDYVRHEVANVDMGWRFSVHVLAPGAVAVDAARDLRSLHAASRDAAAGWALASPTLGAQARAQRPSSAVDATAVVGPGVTLGPGCSVGAGAIVERSSLCAGCSVGAGAVVRDCLLLPGAAVGASGHATGCVLGVRARLEAGSRAPRGCVLGPDVVVAAGLRLPLATRLSACSAGAAHRLVAGGPGNDADLVGAHGVGRAWPAPGELGRGGADDADSEVEGHDLDGDDGEGGATDADAGIVGGVAGVAAAAAALAAVAAAMSAMDALARQERASIIAPSGAVEHAHAAAAAAARAALAFPTLSSGPALPDLEAAVALLASAPPLEPAAVNVAGLSDTGKNAGAIGGEAAALARFRRGVRELFFDGGRAPDPRGAANLALELKSLKYAENRSTPDCLAVVVPLVFGLAAGAGAGSGAGGTAATPAARATPPTPAALKALVAAWAPLLARFIAEPDDELACVGALARFCCALPPSPSALDAAQAQAQAAQAALLRPSFGLLLNLLYDAEDESGLVDEASGEPRGVVSAEAIRAWAARAGRALEDEGAGDQSGGLPAGNPALTIPPPADLRLLLATPFWRKLLQRLDEEEEEEDEDEEGGDDE